jgi:non-heme chloroperoxidase
VVLKESNSNSLDIFVFDGFRSAMIADRAQFFPDVPTGPFFNFNLPGGKASRINPELVAAKHAVRF